MRLDRDEDDYWIGGFMLNFIVGELIAVAAMLVAIVALWPDVPWRPVLYGSLVPAALGPALSYPFSRNVWLALDLIFRPDEAGDGTGRLAGPTGGANVAGPGGPAGYDNREGECRNP